MTHTRLRLPLIVSSGLAAAALLAACSSSGSSSPGAGTPSKADSGTTSTSAPAGSGAQSSTVQSSTAQKPSSGKTITATLTEFHIALSSSELTPGTYTFKVRNAGQITHALTVDGKGVDDKSTSDLDAGQSANLTVTLAPGKYEVFCPVGDHKMEGMDTFVQVG